MKNTITILTASILAIAVSTASFAQTAGPAGSQGTLQTGGQKHKGGMNLKLAFEAEKDILPKLNLSKTQQDQIDDLNKKSMDSWTEIRKDKGDKVARQEKIQALGESYHKQLFSILGPVQEKQFKAEFKKWREEHQKKNKPQAGGGVGTATTGGGTGH